MALESHFDLPEPPMTAITSHPSPSAFAWVSPELFATPIRIDWERTEELYREAFEQAQAVQRPSIINRLTPFWN
jgi:hypothetical protein